MTLRRVSVGLFAAAAIVAVAGVLTFAWPAVDFGLFFAASVGLGLLGLVAGSAYAYLSEPQGRWWGPLSVGAALVVASCAVMPFASALSSATYVWTHRHELDRVASILRSSPVRAGGSRSGTHCYGLGQPECSELADVLNSIGAGNASVEPRQAGVVVHISLRGDFDAAICASSCGTDWSFPIGQPWQLVAYHSVR